MNPEMVINELLTLAANAMIARENEYAARVCVALQALTEATDEQVLAAVANRVEEILSFANQVLADIDAL